MPGLVHGLDEREELRLAAQLVARSTPGRPRRSRASSPRAPGRTAAGRGARCRASRRYGTSARASAKPKPPPSCSRYVARSSVIPRRGAAGPASGGPARARSPAASSSPPGSTSGPRRVEHDRPRVAELAVRQRERVQSSWWPLNSSRNDSSSTWRPRESGRGDLLAVEEHARRPAARRPSPRRACARRRTRNQAASGSPEPSISRAEQELAPAEHGVRAPQRDQLARELEQVARWSPAATSRTRRSRSPGTSRCCCRPGCGRTRRRRAASACPGRAAAWPGSCAAGGRAARGSRDRPSAPRRRSSRTGCRRSRRGCPPCWPRCAWRCRRRGRRSVKPSWAVMKLIEANGWRPSSW